MAQIAVLYDTVSKQMRFMKDGELMDPPNFLDFFKRFDEEGYGMRGVHIVKEDGKTTETIVTAQQFDDMNMSECDGLNGIDKENCKKKTGMGQSRYPQCDNLEGDAKQACIRRAKDAAARKMEEGKPCEDLKGDDLEECESRNSQARDYPGKDKKKKKKNSIAADLLTPEIARQRKEEMDARIEQLIRIKKGEAPV